MINCKELVSKRKEDIKERVFNMQKVPKLVIFQVGNNEASNRYVKHKLTDCEYVGIDARVVNFDENIHLEHMVEIIKDTISETGEAAYMVQLPLPEHIPTDYITNLIPPMYDVDGLSDYSQFTPCTPKGIMMLLDAINEDVKGKHVVVLGRSKLVGKPLVNLLIDKQATVSCLNSQTCTKDRKSLMVGVDVVITAVGKEDSLTMEDLKDSPDVTIIDVGINFDDDCKMCGDCDKEIYEHIDEVTPVPGGVGLYTRLALLENILEV